MQSLSQILKRQLRKNSVYFKKKAPVSIETGAFLGLQPIFCILKFSG